MMTVPWANETKKKIARGLLKMLTEFGLLSNHSRIAKEIRVFKPHPLAVAYLAFELHFSGATDASIPTNRDWSLWQLTPQAVREQLDELSRRWALGLSGGRKRGADHMEPGVDGGSRRCPRWTRRLKPSASELQVPESLNAAKSDPVFYFVHAPDESLAVKQKVPIWVAKLRQDDWEVSIVSFATLVWSIIDRSNRWQEWLAAESDSDAGEINDSIRDVLRGDQGLIGAVSELVSKPIPKRVLFLTDAGLVHPYFRIRTLESGLHGSSENPHRHLLSGTEVRPIWSPLPRVLSG